MTIPKKIFIIPFRNREYQQAIFLNCMEKILKDETDYEIVFSHQTDKRHFNRGAVKNIGFIYVKDTYPNDWENITLIFHDIDYIPYKKLFSYDTTHGSVKHFYGLKAALGGIWAIKGKDYEKIKGFPNYWAWGFEDNKIKDNWEKSGGKINYEEFIEYTDVRIVKLDCSNHGHDNRIVNKHTLFFAKKEKPEHSGYHTIWDLDYSVSNIENNIKMININKFMVEKKESVGKYVKANNKDIQVDYQRRLQRIRIKQHKIKEMKKKRAKKWYQQTSMNMLTPAAAIPRTGMNISFSSRSYKKIQ